MRLGLVYLPSPELSVAFESFALALTAHVQRRMVLGPEAQAHLSLLHVEAPLRNDGDAERLWTEAAQALPAQVRFDLLALGLLRYDTPYNAPPAPPATMAWLIAPCTQALRSAERAAVALPSFASLGCTTQNADAFQPHFTIAMWEGYAAPTFEPPAFLPSTQHTGHLALGEVGPNGTYVRTLYSAPG
jgi:hypothetical protein